MNERVEVPTNKIVSLEFAGLVFDTGVILEDKLKDGRRTSLDKIDRYFYRTISNLLGNNDRPYLPFK
jgi:hypothetical protein